MGQFDLNRTYFDRTGDEIIVVHEELKAGSLIQFQISYNGESMDKVTYIHYSGEQFKDASAPLVNVDDLETVKEQIEEAQAQNDDDLQLYLSSVLLNIQSGLTWPSKELWLEGRSCHESNCSTPFRITQFSLRHCVQVEIPYAQIATECACCNILKKVVRDFIDKNPHADPDNTWVFGSVELGGLQNGKFHIAAPWDGLDATELNTFLEEARRKGDDWNAILDVTRIHGNTLLWRKDIVKLFGTILQCSLYYDSDRHSLDIPSLPILRSISTHALNDSCLDFIKTCWHQCRTGHKFCAPPKNPSSPKRLVFVGETRQSVVRVVEDGIGCQRYAALSYCWGDSALLCLNASTIASFRDEIPWDLLSRTHRDAVEVARKLSIAYIWIDALCIVQDDRADWLEEASKMRDIYAAAELVICADNSPDNGLGFLHDRSDTRQWPSEEAPQRFSHAQKEQQDPEAKLSLWTQQLKDPMDWVKSDHLPWNTHLLYGKLPDGEEVGKRAWCLQEYLSAQRCVRFTSQEVIWDCRTQVLCECGRTVSEPGKTGGFKQSFHAIMGRESLSQKAFMKQWCEVVAEYSGRQLTRNTDKLTAIAGLAKEFASWDVSPYFAGHWEHDGTILSTLLWGPNEMAKLMRPATYIAPSWSWPSTTGSVDLLRYAQGLKDDPNFTSWVWRAQVLDGTVYFAVLDNDYGPVSSGFLKLEASVLAASFKMPTDTSNYSSMRDRDEDDEAMTLTVPPSMYFADPNVQLTETSYHFDAKDYKVTEETNVECMVIYQDYDETKKMTRYVTIMCVPKVVQQLADAAGDDLEKDGSEVAPPRTNKESEDGSLAFLTLEDVVDATSNSEITYERVGIAEFWSENGVDWLDCTMKEIVLV